MKIDHVHFYTRNATRTKDWFIQNVGFQAINTSINSHTHTEVIAYNSVIFLISSPLNSASEVAHYLDFHSPGVADVAFRVRDLESIIAQAGRLNLEVLQPPQVAVLGQEKVKYAKIAGWNSLQHTLIENSAAISSNYFLPEVRGCDCQPQTRIDSHANIIDIDHIVLNVAVGELAQAVALYQTLFGLEIQQSFNIQTSRSGLYSQALVDRSGGVQFNINEPTSADSQIQEFIEINGGSGIQHLALRSPNLIQTVAEMRSRGVSFLSVPQTYYTHLKQRQKNLLPSLNIEEWLAIETEQILVDCDRNQSEALLMQVFTQPIFDQPTFFLEFIERRSQAQGFGQGNFKALFEAVEREQVQRKS